MDPVTKLLATGAIAVMSYLLTLYCLGLLMRTWHDEFVFDNEVLSKECPNYEKDKKFFFTFPALVSLLAAGSFYLFWYQYLPR